MNNTKIINYTDFLTYAEKLGYNWNDMIDEIESRSILWYDNNSKTLDKESILDVINSSDIDEYNEANEAEQDEDLLELFKKWFFKEDKLINSLYSYFKKHKELDNLLNGEKYLFFND